MLKLATIGTSQITRHFIAAANDVERVSVRAIYSRTQNQADNLAKDFDIGKTYTDLNEMLNDKHIDGVYIASPNARHFDQVMTCLKAQKHVICEKPLFTRMHDYNRAYEEADRQGVYLFEAMKNLHTPNFFKLKEALELVGKVRSVYFHRVRYSTKYDQFLEGDVPSAFSREMEGGALRDLGVYPLSLILALFNLPAKTFYHSVKLNTGVDSSGTLLLDYTTFTGVIMCSKVSTSYNSGEIHGERGTLIIDNPSPIGTIRFIPNNDGESRDIQIAQTMPTLSYQIQAFRGVIEEQDDATYHDYRTISKHTVSIIERSGYG